MNIAVLQTFHRSCFLYPVPVRFHISILRNVLNVHISVQETSKITEKASNLCYKKTFLYAYKKAP